MSGITPLIDTLMHQVLGRQGESSLQRSINAPIQPVTPGDGPRALSRDSSLDGRPATNLPIDDLRRLPPSPDQARRGAPAPSGESPPGSTQTHFSPAARSIADVLLRFPAPPTALKMDAPLMGLNEAPSADTLSSRLNASIRDSGLFYEAHLKRWFQGEVPRLQLMREPQMQLARPQAAGQAPAMGAFIGSGAQPSAPNAILPNTSLVFVQPSSAGALPMNGPAAPSSAVPSPGLPPDVASTSAGSAGQRLTGEPGTVERPTTYVASTPSPLTEKADERALTPRETAGLREFEAMASSKREVVHESLQGLVRQQLEMLATPAIRWEGDVWAGIFMALVINLPTGRQPGQEGEGESEEAEQGWHSQMQLDVPNVGAFDVALSLFKSTLNVEIGANDTATHQRLEPSIRDLEARLGALDFQKVRVSLKEPTGDA